MNKPRTRPALQTLLSLLIASCSALAAEGPPPVREVPMPELPRPEAATFYGGMYIVQCLDFAPDGKTLAACMRTWGPGEEDEEVVKLYDLATQRERLHFRSAEDYPDPLAPARRNINRVGALAYAPDGRTIATGDNRKVSLWDAQTGRPRPAAPEPKDSVLALAFAPDGKDLAASFTLPEPEVYDVATGHQRLTLRGHGGNRAGWVWGLAYAPDGKSIVTAGERNTIRSFEAAQGRILWETTAAAPFYSLAFAPDGKRIAAGTDATTPITTDCAVRLFDAATGRERAALMGHSTQVCAVAFTPDGRRLVSLGRGGQVRLWDPATGQLLAAFGRPGLGPDCLALSPDGKTVALGGAYRHHRSGFITLLEIADDGFHLRKPGP